jgi:hypothetical protein
MQSQELYTGSKVKRISYGMLTFWLLQLMYRIHDVVVEKFDDKVVFARILQMMSSQNLVSDQCKIENHYRMTTDVKSGVVDPMLIHDLHKVRSHGEKMDGKGGRM